MTKRINQYWNYDAHGQFVEFNDHYHSYEWTDETGRTFRQEYVYTPGLTKKKRLVAHFISHVRRTSRRVSLLPMAA